MAALIAGVLASWRFFSLEMALWGWICAAGVLWLWSVQGGIVRQMRQNTPLADLDPFFDHVSGTLVLVFWLLCLAMFGACAASFSVQS